MKGLFLILVILVVIAAPATAGANDFPKVETSFRTYSLEEIVSIFLVGYVLGIEEEKRSSSVMDPEKRKAAVRSVVRSLETGTAISKDQLWQIVPLSNGTSPTEVAYP